MKNIKLSYALYFVVASIVSCGTDSQPKNEQGEKPIFEGYKSQYSRDFDIEIVKVRDCEYVLWHNGYGSDMEHYEGCDNPKHCH